MKERLLDVIKWGLIIIIAGAVCYGINQFKYKSEDSRYFLTGGGQGVAYKLDRQTGEVWLVTPNYIKYLGSLDKIQKKEPKKEIEKDERLSKAEGFLAGWERGTIKVRDIDFETIGKQWGAEKFKSLEEIEKAYREELILKEKSKMWEKQKEQMLPKIWERMDRVDAEFEAKEKKQ